MTTLTIEHIRFAQARVNALRPIVIVHPDELDELKAKFEEHAITWPLVKTSDYVPLGQVFYLEPPEEIKKEYGT